MSVRPLTPPNWRSEVVETRSTRTVPTSYDAASHTVECVFSTGAAVTRWGWTEMLEISDAAIDSTRVEAGQVKNLDSHRAGSVGLILGTVESVRVESGALIGKIKFAETDAGKEAEGMVARGELTGISIGYRVTTWEIRNVDTEHEVWVATRWELLEASWVSVPADATAKVRAVQSSDVPLHPSQEQETRTMPDIENPPILTAPPAPAGQAAVETRAAPSEAAPAALTAAETVEIQSFARSCNVEAETTAEIVKPGMTKARAMEFIRSTVAARQATETAPIVPHGTAATVTRDGMVTEGEAIQDALFARMSGQAPSDKGRQFMGYRVLDLLAHRSDIRSRDPMQIMQRASHTTSDFPLLLEAAANKTLMARYKLAAPTYRRLAKKVEFKDFKVHNFLRIGDFPQFQDVNEAGEIKSGTIAESREQSKAGTKGVILMLTRQMLINDDLGAFGGLIQGASNEAGRTENSMFFKLLLLNGTMSDGTAMFHANHKNLATAAAIGVASLSEHRALHRKQVSLSGTAINVPPSILLCGPDKETEAEQVLAPITATSTANYNPFSGKLEPVCDALVTGNQWWTLADPEYAENFVYGYVGGVEGPQLAQVAPFNIDGLGLRVLHDFGVGQNDFRAWTRNAGN